MRRRCWRLRLGVREMAVNILIVDDSKVVRTVIEKTLKLAEVPVGQVHHAANGREALNILADQWVDLIFADINMPVMNGVEMIEKLAADGVLQSIPVVVISTEGSTTRVEQLKQKGVTAYLRKPFRAEQLRDIVNDVLGLSHA